MAKNASKVVPHIMCILDRSGSMSGTQAEIISNFNEFIAKQKAEQGSANLTLVLFDDSYEVVYDKVPLDKVEPIDESIYFVRGMTALNDAIGKTLNANDDEAAIVLIQTDGYENSSREYDQAKVKELIKGKEAKGWDFLFLGADIDVQGEAMSRGIVASKTMAFDKSAMGINMAYDAMSTVTASYRTSVTDTTLGDVNGN